MCGWHIQQWSIAWVENEHSPFHCELLSTFHVIPLNSPLLIKRTAISLIHGKQIVSLIFSVVINNSVLFRFLIIWYSESQVVPWKSLLSIYFTFESEDLKSEQRWLKVDSEEARGHSLNSSQGWNCIAKETIIKNTAFLSIPISCPWPQTNNLLIRGLSFLTL